MSEAALRPVEFGGETAVASLTHMPFELDRGIAHKARIGLVVLATDNTLEHEFRQMLQIDGIAFYESRLPSPIDINPASLAEMEKEIATATGLILPGVKLDVAAYCCTSGTVVIGEEAVFARIREARPGVACSTPITAAIAGLKALGARRIALLTPYVEEVNQMLRRFIEARDIGVPVMGSFNHENDNEVARIAPASIRAAVLELGRYPQVDAVFVSCTSLRLASFVDSLEMDLGKPVTSSNHALAWHCLRLAGYKDPVPGFGRLFRV